MSPHTRQRPGVHHPGADGNDLVGSFSSKDTPTAATDAGTMTPIADAVAEVAASLQPAVVLDEHTECHLWTTTHRLPDGMVVPLVTFNGGRVRVITTVDANSIGAAIDAVRDVRDGHQIYAGIYAVEVDTMRRIIAEGRRGTEAEVAAIHSVIGDVDIAGDRHKANKNYPHDIAEASAVLDGVGIDWSIVIHTGGGLAGWGVLAAPLVIIDDDTRAHVRTVLGLFANGIDAAAGRIGREVDHLADLTRVMRLAGTYNLKAGGKVPALLTTWDASTVLTDDALADACVADPEMGTGSPPAPDAGRQPLVALKSDGPNILAKAIDPLDWSEVWPAGWERRRDTQINGVAVERWRRPGASSDHSVVCWPQGGCKVHSDAVPGLPAGDYSKARVVAHLAGISLSELARKLCRGRAA